jgi:diguanylate cyclase (GGDEF)-like protein/PAS domain S-box-containing protein
MSKLRGHLLEKLVSVREVTPAQQRRGQLLARLIIITAFFNLFLMGINIWLWLSAGSRKDGTYILAALTGFLLLLGIWFINRQGFVSLAAILILMLYTARIGIVSEPQKLAAAFWAFLIPIVIASFIVRPFATFPVAGILAILYLLLSKNTGLAEPLDILAFKIGLLFSLAALSYLMASSLENAIAALNRSEAKYRDLFNHLPVGLYRTSLKGEILDANAAFIKMFGFPDLPTLQRINARDLYSNPSRRQQFLTMVEKTQPIEMQMRKSDGTSFWVTDRAQPIYDPDGKIIYYEGTLIDISEQKRAEQELKYLAMTDPLTGLFNRRQFFILAEQAFNSAREFQTSLAVLMIDLDHFKNINDRYGHAAGDFALHEVSQIIQANLRPNDIAGRYGGEEFSVLLANINPKDGYQIANRLCKALADEPLRIDGENISITLSIGIALFDPTIPSLDALLQQADQALYAAKQAGRNCWKLWNPAMRVSI